MVNRVVNLSRIGGGGGGVKRKQNDKKKMWLYDYFLFYLSNVTIRLYSNYVKCKHVQPKIKSNQCRASGSKTNYFLLEINVPNWKEDKVAVQAEDDEPQNVLSHLVRLFQIEKRACPHDSDTV